MGKKSNEQQPKVSDDVLDARGLTALLRFGRTAESELRFKNRIIAVLVLIVIALSIALSVAVRNEPVFRLLGETSDGRIRPLPLLNDPLYSHEDILNWSQECVRKIYKLSYVDWQTTIQNDTFCLSDDARKGFVDSLKKLGLFENLNAEVQGTLYAVTRQSVLRNARLAEKGYQEWIVDVPYTVVLDGKRRGQLDVVMSMRIRRVSMLWRENGIWVDSYTVKPGRL